MPVSENVNATSAQTTAEKKLLERNFSGGEFDIDFNAYMISKMGFENESNSDNYYMNGIFMDNFKFMDLKKSISNSGESAVFAISSGISSDRASKLVLRFLDQKREWIVSSMSVSQAAERLKQTIIFCNSSLIEEGKFDSTKYEASLIVAVYFRDCIIYASNGKGMLILKRNQKIKNLSTERSHLGVTNALKIRVKKIDFYASDRLIMCSRGVAENNSITKIEYDIASENSPKSIAEKIIGHSINQYSSDTTCMVIDAKIPDGIRRKTIVIAAVSLVWVLINIVIMIALN